MQFDLGVILRDPVWQFIGVLLTVLGGVVAWVVRRVHIRRTRVSPINVECVHVEYSGSDDKGTGAITIIISNHSGHTIRNDNITAKTFNRLGTREGNWPHLWNEIKIMRDNVEGSAWRKLEPESEQMYFVSYNHLAKYLDDHRIKFWEAPDKPHKLFSLVWPDPINILLTVTYNTDTSGKQTEEYLLRLKCRFPETLSYQTELPLWELKPVTIPVWLVKRGWILRTLSPFNSAPAFQAILAVIAVIIAIATIIVAGNPQ